MRKTKIDGERNRERKLGRDNYVKDRKIRAASRNIASNRADNPCTVVNATSTTPVWPRLLSQHTVALTLCIEKCEEAAFFAGEEMLRIIFALTHKHCLECQVHCA